MDRSADNHVSVLVKSLDKPGVVAELLENPEIRNDLNRKFGYYTCLQLACQNETAEIVRLLLAAGADPFKRDDSIGDTAAHHVIQPPFIEVNEKLAVLLDTHPVLLEKPDAAGNTLLVDACYEGLPESVELLLGKGADTNVGEQCIYSV